MENFPEDKKRTKKKRVEVEVILQNTDKKRKSLANLSGKSTHVSKYKLVHSFLTERSCRAVREKISRKKDPCFSNVSSRVCLDQVKYRINLLLAVKPWQISTVFHFRAAGAQRNGFTGVPVPGRGTQTRRSERKWPRLADDSSWKLLERGYTK